MFVVKSPKRLTSIIQLNELKERDATKALGDRVQQLELNKKRLSDLESYRLEYGRNILGEGRGLTASKLQDYQTFLNNLNYAVEQQKTAIKQLVVEYENAKRQWLAARNRSKAIQTVQKKYELMESIEEGRREQREQDDRNNSKNNR